MNNIFSYMTENNDFTFNKNGHVIEKHLFDDYIIVFKLDDEFNEGIYIYLNSVRFSKIMDLMFNDHTNKYNYMSLAHQYLPRKLRKDKSGNLAMGLVGFSEEKPYGEINNGGESIKTDSLSEIIKSMNSKSMLLQHLYHSPFNSLVATIEGVWVYIYLSFEAGLTVKDILLSLSINEVTTEQMSCVLKQDIDREVLEEFEINWKKVTL